MRKLIDYEGEGGEYLPDGWHDVRISDFEMIENPKSGNAGVQFVVEDDRQRKQKIAFWLTDKATWRLANFAKACELPESEYAEYDIDDDRSHRVLIGKKVSVEIARQSRGDPKYGEIVDFQSISEVKPAARPPEVQQPTQETTASKTPF